MHSLFKKAETMDLIKQIEDDLVPESNYPDFRAGDTVNVHFNITEGDKTRVQQFRGVVIQRKGSGLTETFTVRKISAGIGVERIFPIHSPKIEKIEQVKKGKVRRARIFYQRKRSGKKSRIREALRKNEQA